MSDRVRRVLGAGAGGAFTLTELLVVIVILVLVLGISVPAFTSIMYSQEATLAQTRLATALRAARDAALQSSTGTDTAAVFFYDQGGRARIVTCVKAGEMDDRVAGGGGTGGGANVVRREIFVPLETVEPVELPRGWMIRGYVPAFSINQGGSWYEQYPAAGGVRYGGTSGDEPAWVFPETGFFRTDRGDQFAGASRQTFMVRFQGGSGIMAPTNASEVLVLAPHRNRANRDPALPAWQRADLASDYRRFVRRLLTAPNMTIPRAGNPLQKLLGDESPDTVLARPVMMLAVYDERKLAAALGVTIDRNSGCLYRGAAPGTEVRYPQFVDVPGRSSAEIGRLITQWISGHTRLDDPPAPNDVPRRDRGDQPEARIFTVNRFTGELRQVEVEL